MSSASKPERRESEMLIEALITRSASDVDAAIDQMFERTEPADLGSILLRFSVMSFSPSMHSRCSFYSTLAACDLLAGATRDQSRTLLRRAAEYAAEAHVPWGETPVTTPPDFVEGDDDPEVILAAAGNGDLRGAERWVAALLASDSAWETRFLETARHLAGEEGWGLATACASVRASRYFPPVARFATLRCAVKEWMQDPSSPGDLPRLAEAVESYDGETGELARVIVAEATDCRSLPNAGGVTIPAAIDYRWSSDFGSIPQLLSIAMRNGVGSGQREALIDKARINLESGVSYSEWSFA